jgi:hypothetical protein
MAKQMATFLPAPVAMLQMWEMGLLRQSRAANGDLVWSVAKDLDEAGLEQALAAADLNQAIEPNDLDQVSGHNDSSDILLDSTTSVVIEFELDEENMLLLRAQDFPPKNAVLNLREISQQELRALFNTAAKLLAGTKPDDQMRAYASRVSSGEWQVKLLPP